MLDPGGVSQHPVTPFIEQTIYSLIIVLGTIGNALCLIVMLRRPMKGTPPAVFFASLAISDTVVIYCGLLRHWIKQVFHTDIRDYSDLSCKLQPFLTIAAMDLSVWILSALTVERCMCVRFPFRYMSWGSWQKNVRIVLGLLVASLLLNAHLFATRVIVKFQSERVQSMDISSSGGAQNLTTAAVTQKTISQECVYVDWSRDFAEFVLPWVIFVIYSCGPFLIICTSNAIVVRTVAHRRGWFGEGGGAVSRKTAGGVFSTAGNERTSMLSSTVNFQAPNSSAGVDTSIGAHGRSSRETTSGKDKAHGLTAMMFCVSVVFLFTSFPTIVRKILYPYIEPSLNTASARADYDLIETIIKQLQYLQYCVNFYLYCISGATFRQSFKRLVRKSIRCVGRSKKSNEISRHRYYTTGGTGGGTNRRMTRALDEPSSTNYRHRVLTRSAAECSSCINTCPDDGALEEIGENPDQIKNSSAISSSDIAPDRSTGEQKAEQRCLLPVVSANDVDRAGDVRQSTGVQTN